MKLIPVQVECHSGAKSDEYPVRFYWQTIKYEIREIADRWFQAAQTDEGRMANYFKVRTASRQEFILKHELQSGNWYLVKKDGPEMLISLN